MRSTFSDLIAQVRAQIDVDEDLAYAWLLDRARVLNAESGWYLLQGDASALDDRHWLLPEGTLWVEAVLAGPTIYQRSTLHALDARYSGQTGNTSPIYADAPGVDRLQLHPAPSVAPTIRYVSEIPDVDRNASPVFPADFDQALVDGAVSIGLARMDERFDSASYFEQRFQIAIPRLRRRRHGHVGRGATSIRVAL